MLHKQNLRHPKVVLGDEYFLPEIEIKADPENGEEETSPNILTPLLLIGAAIIAFNTLS